MSATERESEYDKHSESDCRRVGVESDSKLVDGGSGAGPWSTPRPQRLDLGRLM